MICSNEVENANASSEAVTAWFAKSLCFLRICTETEDLSTKKDDVRPDRSTGSSHIQTELCFLQFFKVLEANRLAVDAVNNALGCVRLRWHKEDAEEERY